MTPLSLLKLVQGEWGVKNLAYVMLHSYIYVDTLYGWFCDIEFGWDFFEALHLTENVEKTCRLRGVWK